MLTEKDQIRIADLGRSLELILRQEEQLKKGPQTLNALEVAVIGDGIHQLSSKKQEIALRNFQRQDASHSWQKFVPASGAASRMFSDLYKYWDEKRKPNFNFKQFLDHPQNKEFKKFITNLKRFPFYANIYGYLSDHAALFDLEGDSFFDAFVDVLLNENHLAYNQLPKGLITFFSDEKGNAFTPFEAHLEEALNLSPENQKIKLHFTIDKEHRKTFETLAELFLNSKQASLEISYSYQHPLTDTPVLDHENKWVRDERDQLLFRKGGHGALLENLNQMNTNFVWLKNIDNIQWSELNNTTIQWMQILGGITLEIQKEIFKYLKDLDNQKQNIDSSPVVNFIHEYFDKTFELQSEGKPSYEKLKDYLHRPLRVCGMIKNEGKAGGGPFWVHTKRGRHLQIIEGVELDSNSADYNSLIQNSTHFNPVLMVCAIKDVNGEKFALHEFSDDQRYITTHKTVGPKKIKALEWPGLWNGGMAHWNTFFVEVPKQTFHPVKKITDLLSD